MIPAIFPRSQLEFKKDKVSPDISLLQISYLVLFVSLLETCAMAFINSMDMIHSWAFGFDTRSKNLLNSRPQYEEGYRLYREDLSLLDRFGPDDAKLLSPETDSEDSSSWRTIGSTTARNISKATLSSPLVELSGPSRHSAYISEFKKILLPCLLSWPQLQLIRRDSEGKKGSYYDPTSTSRHFPSVDISSDSTRNLLSQLASFFDLRGWRDNKIQFCFPPYSVEDLFPMVFLRSENHTNVFSLLAFMGSYGKIEAKVYDLRATGLKLRRGRMNNLKRLKNSPSFLWSFRHTGVEYVLYRAGGKKDKRENEKQQLSTPDLVTEKDCNLFSNESKK
jgi:hypothetical protein